jgi:WD40 repeat protein
VFLSSGEVLSVAYSPDGNWIASGGGFMDNTVRIWDAATGAAIWSRGHSGEVTNVAFNPIDPSQLVSCSADGTTRYWNVATGEAQSEVSNGKFEFAKLSDREQTAGRYTITAQGDLLRIYETPQGEEKAKAAPVAFFRAPVSISAFDCAGESICVGCTNGEVLHLRARVLVQEAQSVE